jgi:hypothetical protein
MTPFGETGTAELISLIGLYCAVSVKLNGFDALSLKRTCGGDQTLGPIPRQEPSIATVGVSNGRPQMPAPQERWRATGQLREAKL